MADSMTLAFDLTALRRLEHPRAVFVDARQWTQNVGVVADDPEDVRAFTARHALRHEFQPRSGDEREDLRAARERFDTERYVLVCGDSTGGNDTHGACDWECIGVEEAAEKAGWSLDSPRPWWRQILPALLRGRF